MLNGAAAVHGQDESHRVMVISQAKDFPESVLPDVYMVSVSTQLDDALKDAVTDAFMQADPSLIVVDCRQRLDILAWVTLIREYPAGRESHVVIMTHDARDWMQCMDFDVDDIVYVKPAEPFLASYATVMARFMRTLALRTQIFERGQQVHNAIVTAAEYGALLHFMEAAESRTELADLVSLVLKRLQEKNLEALIHVTTPSGIYFHPLENVPEAHIQLTKKLANSPQRMIAFERFLGFRYGGFTLLVTNAPFEDPHQYGRIKDSLAHLCALAESRAKSILVKQSIQEHHQKMLGMLDVIREVTNSFHGYTQKVMQDLTTSIEQAAITFDM